MKATRTLVVALAAAFGLTAEAQAGFLLFNDLDVTTGGTATGSGNSPANEQPPLAFDNNVTTKGLIFAAPTGGGTDITAANPATYTYAFGTGVTRLVRSYSITSANDASDRDPRDFILEGSNDGNTFVPVDTRTNVTFNDQPTVGNNQDPANAAQAPPNGADRFETLFFTAATPGVVPFSQYRLRIIETRGTGATLTQVAEIQLFESAVVPEPASCALLSVGAMGLLARRRRG